MDLRELNDIHANRHPWETARLKALQRILAPCAFEGMRVLDMGCGDGFVARGLFTQIAKKEITAVDIHFTKDMLQALSASEDQVKYFQSIPDDSSYDLVLLLDILEHVEDDREFITDLVARHITRGGRALITVPAFQCLYSHHDKFLGHFRRYTLHGLSTLATAAGLRIVSSGYLFFSLLLPKFLIYKVAPSATIPKGVGQWRQGRLITTLLESMLVIDNYLLLAASSLGFKIPGLTGWLLCEKSK